MMTKLKPHLTIYFGVEQGRQAADLNIFECIIIIKQIIVIANTLIYLLHSVIHFSLDQQREGKEDIHNIIVLNTV